MYWNAPDSRQGHKKNKKGVEPAQMTVTVGVFA
jgi:hypothetical protein